MWRFAYKKASNGFFTLCHGEAVQACSLNKILVFLVTTQLWKVHIIQHKWCSSPLESVACIYFWTVITAASLEPSMVHKHSNSVLYNILITDFLTNIYTYFAPLALWSVKMCSTQHLVSLGTLKIQDIDFKSLLKPTNYPFKWSITR